MRWAAILFAALPLLLLLIAAAAPSDTSRHVLRAAKYAVAIELLLVIIFAVIGASYERRNRVRESALYQPPGKLIDIGGYRLHLYCTGASSPTVILDFGLDGSYLDWYRVQPQLAGSVRVCSYDRSGYGWSDTSPRQRIPSEMVDELHTALDRAGEKPPFIFVGHSFGGFNALMFAHKYPADVAGVVLVDMPHPQGKIAFSWQKKLWLRMMQLTVPFGLPRWRRWCVNGPAEIEGLKTALVCRSHVYATNYAQFATFGASAAEVGKLPPMRDIPLSVISRDPKRAGANFEAEQRWQEMQLDLLRMSTNSRHIVAEGSGHGIPVERPDAIVSAVMEMVGKLRTAK